MRRFGRSIAIAALLVAAAAPLRAANIYVAPGGTGDGSIGSPAGLQAALDTARVNGEDDVLYLQQGTYAGATFTFDLTGDDADADADLALSGGWAAGYATQAQDPALTELSGEGVRRVLMVYAQRAGRRVDLSLERLTVRDGYADQTGCGAGLLAFANTAVVGQHGVVNLALEDCVFRDNALEHGPSSGSWGGAISLVGSLRAERCAFVGNHSGHAAAVDVGIYDWVSGPAHDHAIAATFVDCEFRDNTSDGDDGPVVMRAMGNALTMEGCLVHNTTGATSGVAQTILATESTVRMDRCEFRGNVVEKCASAIYLLGSPALITNSLFVDNWAGAGGAQGGAAIAGRNFEVSGQWIADHLDVVNSTFVNNRGLNGQYGILDLQAPQTATFSNCILWGNEAPAARDQGSLHLVRNSDIQYGPAANTFVDGGGNLDAAPVFRASDPYYHLEATSPGVDQGFNDDVPAGVTTDFEGDPRIFAYTDRGTPRVDMGWDEYEDAELQFTAPAAGAFWLNDGTPRAITWICQNVPGDVRLFLWQGERSTGHEVLEISPATSCAAGSYDWTPPTTLDDAGDYAIAVGSLAYPPIGHGVGPVAIQHLRLLSPNGGQRFTQGSTYPITWESGDLGTLPVHIDLYGGAGMARTISAGAANTGSFSWKVPYTLLPGADYRIELRAAADTFVARDFGDMAFRVLPAVTVTAPNGGERVRRGLTCKIAWTYKNNPGATVRIELHKAGRLNRTIATRVPRGAAGKGSYLWTIPATQAPGGGYTVKVRGAAANCFDFGNRAFTILR